MRVCYACSADLATSQCPSCGSEVCFIGAIPGVLRCGNTNEVIPEEWPHVAGCEAWCQRCEGSGTVQYPAPAPGADVYEDCPVCAGIGTRPMAQRGSRTHG